MCPHDNVELRLRPPGIDLWTTHIQSAGEASLLFLLLGAVYLHRMPHVLSLLHIDPSLLDSQLTFCGVALAALSVPGLLLWAAHTAVNVGWALGSGASGMTGSQLSPSPAYHATLGPTIMRSSASFLTLAYAYVSRVPAAAEQHCFVASWNVWCTTACCPRWAGHTCLPDWLVMCARAAHHQCRCRWCGLPPWPTMALSSLRRPAWCCR